MENNNLQAFSRRKFLASGTLLMTGFLFQWNTGFSATENAMAGKPALSLQHFPSKLHAFLWRNWHLVPIDRLAKVVGAGPSDLMQLAVSIGLPPSVFIPSDQQSRSYLTIIRSNWHLLPREQLLTLLDWTDKQFTFTLQEDDFFYIKLGSLKPECSPITFNGIKEKITKQTWITKVLLEEFPKGIPRQEQPLFHFVKELSKAPTPVKTKAPESGFSPRFGYSYFALFGDPLLNPEIDPLPDGYLAQISASGMDSTWIHIVLSQLAPFPWDMTMSTGYEERLKNLNKLIERTKKLGIGIYLYLNEPRYMPLSFFEKYPDLKGAVIGDQAALCTSHPDVQKYLVEAIATITRAAPNLAGFFSITASENHTNCWSHNKGNTCPRCSKRGPATVISELNRLYQSGIELGIGASKKSTYKTSTKIPQLIIWDWGWQNGWAEQIIPQLPKSAALMSVSEWDLPIERGGIKSKIGEYSISAIGPGPRALRHWDIARNNGLKTIAKIQAGNTWEIGAVPYIPALENVAQHAANLRDTKVDGMMLGWTLGGYPSPNLEVVAAIGNDRHLSPIQAMELVAKRRYGNAGKAIVKAWSAYSAAFTEFPFGHGLYFAPSQMGPANLLWEKPTGYAATMVGLPYDDINRWTGNYGVKIFIQQMNKIADGFESALEELREQTKQLNISGPQRKLFNMECNVAETIAIHYRSAANQALFTTTRDNLIKHPEGTERQANIDILKSLLTAEIALAKQMHKLQSGNSALGYEASNHYFYTPSDLLEKVLNCRDLLDRWIPQLG